MQRRRRRWYKTDFKTWERRILTAIDKTIVVGLEGLVSITLLGKIDGSNTLWTSGGIVTKENLLDGSNSLIEEIL
jgi:hypothetical protein